MYTFADKDGRRDLTIEHGLSKLEDSFEKVRRDKIMRCGPLEDEDKAILFLFVATARFRTPKNRDHWKRQFGKAIDLGDRISAHVQTMSSEEKAALDSLPEPSGPTFSIDVLRALAEQPLQGMISDATNVEAIRLSEMTATILCASDGAEFITSDAPVVWFDPELHKMPRFYRNPALDSPTIEVTMPIAPSRYLLLTHGRMREGYVPIPGSEVHWVDEINRRTRFHCVEHFISSSNERKDIWFDPGTPPLGWQDR